MPGNNQNMPIYMSLICNGFIPSHLHIEDTHKNLHVITALCIGFEDLYLLLKW